MLVSVLVLTLVSAAHSHNLEDLFRGNTVRPPPSAPSPAPATPAAPRPPSATPAPPRPPAPSPAPANPAARAAADQKALLDAHNVARAKHCLAPLSWSVEAALAAQKWANLCKREADNSFMHDPDNEKFGENLAWGGGLGAAESVGLWYEEIKDYDFKAPVFTEQPQVGHLTQMLWRTTTHVGCAMALCGGENYWVCRYSPPGNVNVVARGGVTVAQARQSLIRNVPGLCR
jgi:uncharacterized protein YkwD